MLPVYAAGKDKNIGMILVKLFRKHFIKLVIGTAVIYLVAAFHFFGSVDQQNKSKSNHHQREVLDPDKAPIPNIKEVSIGDKNKRTVATFQKIDKDDHHKRERLQVLKEIYAVPHTPDDVYKLNESLSRTIDLDRPPSDLRPDQCKTLTYDYSQLPTISIILPIYNEALSMLLRAVHSAINNTPEHLLVDIILVDDDSKNENLKEPLDRYLKYLPNKVRVLRNDKRDGLIRARMRGASVAKGDVLMFQDVHTEFSPGWAEPILQYIKTYPNTIVQPAVEELNVNTISWPNKADINYDEMWRGVFMWDMRYAWNKVPRKYSSWKLTEVDPFPNPVLVGCSLAIGRKFFDHIGGFDKGLNIWGGENIELSLRTWMCGGRMVIHPCSRIAHVFKPFSYKFDGDKEIIIGKNSARVVEAWMDDFRHYFYASNFVYPFKRTELNEAEKESLRKHKALRKKLQCKSFEWYLQNVLPEMATPPQHVRYFGEIQNDRSKSCLQVNDDGWVSVTMDCYTYSRLKHEQEFGITKSGQLLHFDKCIAVQNNFLLRSQHCGTDSEREKGWSFEVASWKGMQIGTIKFTFADGTVKCLQQITNIVDVYKNQQMPQVVSCKQNDENWQKWYITYNLDYSLVPNRSV